MGNGTGPSKLPKAEAVPRLKKNTKIASKENPQSEGDD